MMKLTKMALAALLMPAAAVSATAQTPAAELGSTPIYGLDGELMIKSDCSTSASVGGKTYHYALKGKVGEYDHGAASATGAYEIESDSTFTEYTYFMQVCGDMQFSSPANQPVCGSTADPTSNCPETCKGSGSTCGTSCGALQSQKNTGSSTSYCWTLGMWNGGSAANVTLLDPANPNAGLKYTLTGGDDFGCPGTTRSMTLNIACPKEGRSGKAIAPSTVTEISTCAYEADMTHPAACPGAAGKLPGEGGMSWGGYFFIFSTCIPAVYFAVNAGLAHRAGQTGIDLIPHMDFFRDMPTLASEGVGHTIDGIKAGFGKLRGGGGDGGFSTIS